MTFARYYTVTGERVLFREDERGKRIETARIPSAVRFSTVRLGDAQHFATDVFRRERVTCEIHEHDRRAG